MLLKMCTISIRSRKRKRPNPPAIIGITRHPFALRVQHVINGCLQTQVVPKITRTPVVCPITRSRNLRDRSDGSGGICFEVRQHTFRFLISPNNQPAGLAGPSSRAALAKNTRNPDLTGLPAPNLCVHPLYQFGLMDFKVHFLASILRLS